MVKLFQWKVAVMSQKMNIYNYSIYADKDEI